MKKLLSIPFALLILISGMHISIARHICKGEITATEWSFTGQTAECDMEKQASEACPLHQTVDSKCCQNQVDIYSVENDYNKSSYQYKEVSQTLLQIFSAPVSLLNYAFFASEAVNSNLSPPKFPLSSAVSLDRICIFRI